MARWHCFVFLDLVSPYTCVNKFRETTGFMDLTPTYYCPFATWEIQAVDGSVITITFSFIYLADNYEDGSIEVVLHY